MNKLRVLMGLAIMVVVVIAVGQWHWNQTIRETTEQIDFEQYLTNKKERQLAERVQPREKTIIDMKVEFSVVFEEEYLQYETAINQLLLNAEQEYFVKLQAEEFESYEWVQHYQTRFLEIEEEWAKNFWREYEQLQDEMEAAGYFRDDAFEYELEFELRREQTTHAFLQTLMMMGL